MNPNEALADQLAGVEAAIQREQEAEQRGTTRYSRLPGLYAERDRLKYQIALDAEPRDRAYALAAEISTLPNSDRLAVAARLRALDPYLAVAATSDSEAVARQVESTLSQLSLALAFSLAAGDHQGARADVRKAQGHLAALRDLLTDIDGLRVACEPDTVKVPRDVLRAYRESLADGLETVGSAEAEWSTKDRALVASIDALLAGGES